MQRPVITVDASELATHSQYRGIGTYLREILSRLAARPDVEVRALTARVDVLPPGAVPVLARRWALIGSARGSTTFGCPAASVEPEAT